MRKKKSGLETAMFAAGCFWGIERAFREVPGVVDVVVGYAGGQTEHPSYEEVSSGSTGHAETVQVIYDPKKVTYEKLLDGFWTIHDPTQLNRQGPDIGSQYRSIIFYTNEAQRKAAEALKKKLQESGKYTEPIVTKIVKAGPFYKAEEYHQRYLEKRGLNVC